MPGGNRGLFRFTGPQQPGGAPWLGAINARGTLANRPVPSAALVGFSYYATDVATQYECQLTAGVPSWAPSGLGALPVSTKTASFTAGTTSQVYRLDVSAASMTVTLPACAGNAGLVLYFAISVMDGAVLNTASIGAVGGNVINGLATSGKTGATLYYANDWLGLYCDGTVWRVHEDGRRLPAESDYTSVNIAVANATVTKVTLNTSTYSQFNMLSATKITAKRGGRYLCVAYLGWAANGTGQRQIYLYKNGVADVSQVTPATGAQVYQTISQVYLLADADYIELAGWQSSGGALNVLGGSALTNLALYFLGDQ